MLEFSLTRISIVIYRQLFQQTFVAQGTSATWEHINKISAAIPTLHKVKDHVKAKINHWHQGKAHTTPDKEDDIARLQASYKQSHIHQYMQGRQICGDGKSKDYIAMRADPVKLKCTMKKWVDKCLRDRGNIEDWLLPLSE